MGRKERRRGNREGRGRERRRGGKNLSFFLVS
jgi:hypothetical protein